MEPQTVISWAAIIFLVVVLILFLIILEVKRLILSRRYKHIPGVQEIPIVGSTLAFQANIVKDVQKMLNRICFAKITKLFVGPKVVFFISDPDTMQAILSSRNFTDRPFPFKFFRLPFGIVTATYDQWKPTRKALSPAFSQRKSSTFVPILVRKFAGLAQEITEHKGKSFNIFKTLLKLNMELIMETYFGVKDATDIIQFQETIHRFEENVTTRLISPLLYPNFIYSRSKLAREDRQIDEEILKFNRKLDQLRSYYSKRKCESPHLIRNLIDFAKTDDTTSEKVLLQNMISIIVAGYETVTLTLAATILMLAMHPEVDAKVQAELSEFYETGQPIDHILFQKLIYLDMVIKEALRLFPPIPIVARQNLVSVEIDKIGYVAEGTIFMTNFFSLHRWKDIWGEDADQFKPERFSAEQNANRHHYAFLPFSHGPRNCIGSQYAIFNLKVGLVSLLSQFKFETDLKMDHLQFSYGVLLRIENGIIVRAISRLKKSSTKLEFYEKRIRDNCKCSKCVGVGQYRKY